MKRTIYCYHFKETNIDRMTNGKKPLFKIGDTTIIAETTDEAARQRIAQQDTTSTYEKPEMDWAEAIPEDFMPAVEHVDKEFHAWLKKVHNIYKARKDADREWYDSFSSADEVKEYLNEFLHGVHRKNSWNMRTHQAEACNKMVSYYETYCGPFLLAAKMRFGKNFTFLNAVKMLGYKNILVLTYKPGVFDSLQEDIENHIFFNNFIYTEYKEKRTDLCLYSDKVNIVACSAQMAGYKYDEETEEETFDTNNKYRKNLEKLAEFKWDLIVTDECHYGTLTENFQNIHETLKCDRILYISGTPFKTIANYKDNQIYMYTYLDEQNTPGNTMAKLHQYAIQLDSKLIEEYKKCIEIVDYPTMTKIFHADNNGNFISPEVAKPFIDYILTKDIYRVETDVWDILALLDHKNAVKACTKYVNEKYGDKFFAIDGSNDISKVENLKEIIAEANKKHKKSITFSCGRFIEGTSIKQWNTVIMLHDGSSPERYFQTMFRGQTPAPGKTDFYVIDYNPNRCLCMNHYIINEFPTGKTANKTKEQNAKEWLKAAQIIIIDNDSDQTQRIVNYKEIENVFFHNERIGYNMFTHSSVMNRIQFVNIDKETLNYIIDNMGKLSEPNKDCTINDNGLNGGKNKTSLTDAKKQPKGNSEKPNKEGTITELIRHAKNIAKFLPRYILSYNCKNFEDINNSCLLNKDKNQEMFFEYTQCSYDLFMEIVNANVFNIDGINYVINTFWDEYNTVIKMDAVANYNFDLRWNIYK